MSIFAPWPRRIYIDLLENSPMLRLVPKKSKNPVLVHRVFEKQRQKNTRNVNHLTGWQ